MADRSAEVHPDNEVSGSYEQLRGNEFLKPFFTDPESEGRGLDKALSSAYGAGLQGED